MESRRFRATNRGRKRAAMRAALLALMIVVALVVVRYSPLSGLLTADKLSALLDKAGFWAPIAYIIIYAAGVCLFVPGTILTALGAAVFGPYWGFVYVWMGAMAGASLAFLIGRYLGRDFAAALIGNRLKKYDEAVGRNGFATVLYLRLVYFPFTPVNFGMGLTRVRFRDYFAGTGLGILVGTFIFTFFIGTVKEALANGSWNDLLTWQIFLALGLFIFSFFIPRIIRRLKKAESIEIE